MSISVIARLSASYAWLRKLSVVLSGATASFEATSLIPPPSRLWLPIRDAPPPGAERISPALFRGQMRRRMPQMPQAGRNRRPDQHEHGEAADRADQAVRPEDRQAAVRQDHGVAEVAFRHVAEHQRQ